MRAIRAMPEEEQQVILQHMASEIRFIRHMVSGPSETSEVVDEQFDEDDEHASDKPEPEPGWQTQAQQAAMSKAFATT